jgi:hypothetical protein
MMDGYGVSLSRSSLRACASRNASGADSTRESTARKTCPTRSVTPSDGISADLMSSGAQRLFRKAHVIAIKHASNPWKRARSMMVRGMLVTVAR